MYTNSDHSHNGDMKMNALHLIVLKCTARYASYQHSLQLRKVLIRTAGRAAVIQREPPKPRILEGCSRIIWLRHALEKEQIKSEQLQAL